MPKIVSDTADDHDLPLRTLHAGKAAMNKCLNSLEVLFEGYETEIERVAAMVGIAGDPL